MHRRPGVPWHVRPSWIRELHVALILLIVAALSISATIAAQPDDQPDPTQTIELGETSSGTTSDPGGTPVDDPAPQPPSPTGTIAPATEAPPAPTQPVPTQLPPQPTETLESDAPEAPQSQARGSFQIASSVSLTANGETDLLIVAAGTSVLLEATGIPAETSATLLIYPESASACSGSPLQSLPMPEASPGTYQYSVVSPLRITSQFQVVTAEQVSNCVVVIWGSQGIPLLTGDGSLGPLTVPIGTTVELVGQMLSPGSTAFIRREEGRCGTGSWTEIFRGQAAPDGTISLPTVIDREGVFAFRLYTTSATSSNCLIVEGVLPPIDLTANGTAGPVTVESGDTVSLGASGLRPGEQMTVTTHAESCGGDVLDTQTLPVPASGTYETTVDSATSATRAYVVTSGGVTSNCVEVTWNSTPILTVNGSAGPMSAPVGETVLAEVSGVDPGASVVILRGATGCGTATETIGSGVANDDGAMTVPVEVDRLAPVFLQAVADTIASNCVEVTGTQAAFTLTANGATGVVTVDAGTAVLLEASGIVAGSPATLHTYGASGSGNPDMNTLQSSSCAGDPIASETMTVTAGGVAAWERAEPNAVTLAYQVEANGVRSNCVEVSWLALPTMVPTAGPTVVPTEAPTVVPTERSGHVSSRIPPTVPATAPASGESARGVHPEPPPAVTSLPSTGTSPSNGSRWMLPMFWSAALLLLVTAASIRGARRRHGT